jgi:hypothetical protein
MRISFITAALSNDGVGDYTRLLAESCQRMGHACQIVSLCDHEQQQHPLVDSKDGVQISRFLGNAFPKSKLSGIRKSLSDFQPDWISLQFVPYGFEKRGCLRTFPSHLKSTLPEAKLHVMFHEIWSGIDRLSPLKIRILGALQRRYIKKMLKLLEPQSIHTSNTFYKKNLIQESIKVDQLPLFGNIPYHTWKPDAARREFIEPYIDSASSDWIHIGLFGSIHREWNPEPSLSQISEYAAQAEKQILFASVGRMGAAGELIWDTMQERHPEITFIRHGEASPQSISGLLQCLDFGIATSPMHIIEKSGTAKAMLEHGLPVVVTRLGEADCEDTPTDTQIFPFNADFSQLYMKLEKTAPQSGLELTTQQFIQALS